MRVSLKWLREYVDLTLSPAELAQRLTLATVEVEGIEHTRNLDGMQVGEVIAAERIPQSDHLRKATVMVGDARYQVVCGAPNVQAGQKIAYAGIGSQPRDPRTGEPRVLKAAKLLGVESQGMILSERELGLSDEHEGILVLPSDAPVGMPLAEYLGDTVLVAGSWAHRADLLSMIGIAREVAALTNQRVMLPDERFHGIAGPIAGEVEVTIEDSDLCNRYVAALVEGVTVGPSPAWMQERLRAAGVRPISNVVDITNYVMLEYGQPLHAFDFEQIRGHHINVRRARTGERLTTLDGVERALTPEMLLICDASGPTALAGVMGGRDSEVTDSTTAVLIEAANFAGKNIRRTSMQLGLRSEASTRFEKGLPASLAVQAARRAAHLLVEHAGGHAFEGLIDAYPVPQREIDVRLSRERLRRVLGIEIAPDEVVGTLTALGFEVILSSDTEYAVRVPPWRTDIAIADDVVEEVIRILGFERLPETAISGRIPPELPQPHRQLRERIKDLLVAAGAQEIITYSAVSWELLAKITPAEDLQLLEPLRVVNPMSGEHEFLRTTLRGSAIETLKANLRLRRPLLSLFETAVTFLPGERRYELPEEREMLVGVLSGARLDRWGRASAEALDFFDAKGYVELIAAGLGVNFAFRAAADVNLVDGITAAVLAGDATIGVVGQLHPDLLARFDIEQPVYLYELNLAALLPFAGAVRRFTPIPRFPAVEQDLAVVVDRELSAADLLQAIRSSKLVATAQVFDEYVDERLGAGKKSLAISISYQSAERTLTDADVAKEQQRLLSRLQHQFGAQLRS